MSDAPSMGWSGSRALLSGGVALAILLGAASVPAVARAQSAADREAAATAFDRGTSAYLAHDYTRAAQWFETAYGMAPSSAALIQSIRANNRAGNLLRAATLALQIPALYADDAAATRLANELIPQATPLFVRVDVTCTTECSVELDGGIVTFMSFFVEPDADHRIAASFETGTVEATVNAAAGEARPLSFEAPPPPAVAVVDEDDDTDDVAPTPPPSGGGISPAFFITGAVLTVLAGGGLVGAGIYTLDGVPAYERAPTSAGLADGQSRETLTNAMIGVTAALAATTVLLAVFTDWDGDPARGPATEEEPAPSSVEVTASIGASPEGASLALLGTF